MSVPEAAVEAAAIAFAAEADPYGEWDKQAEAYRAIYRERASRILRAAAPHIRVGRGERDARISQAATLEQAIEAFPLNTIQSPNDAIIWLSERAMSLRVKADTK